ncbi:MAG: hypothetical protein NTU88_13940, partial [Armatimonadetes bacterium]|nr:hypothetical protein [Armatimonadota bacterium]
MRTYLLISFGILLLVLVMTLPASALDVQCGVAQYNDGQTVSFARAFPSSPVIVTSAQKDGKAVSSCAVSNAAGGFSISLRDDAKRSVSGAWVQWIAFIPDAGKKVLGGVMQANDGQNISFPAMSGTPVIVTSAQKGGAVNACAVNNANNGFYLVMRDQDNKPVQGAWLQWMAVIPGTDNGFKGDVAQRSNGANVTCAAFPTGPTYVVSAQGGFEPFAAGGLNNRNDGFTLSLTKHDGSAGSGWAQWLGYAPPPPPTCYAVIVGGENTGNPY